MNTPLFIEEPGAVEQAQDAAFFAQVGGQAEILARLRARRLDPSKPPAAPPPVLFIGETPVATVGNITVVTAQAKSGKTAFVGAVLSAAITAETGEQRDNLGVKAKRRPPGAVVPVFDTEQSEADLFACMDRVARRAGVGEVPDWIWPYPLAGDTALELRAALRAELADLKAAGVPVWFVVLDGIADFCANPNDIEESQAVVTEAHAHARDSACPLIAVMHRNEGEKADSTARGHLGKQLARKAAFNLILERDADQIVTVYATQNRGAPIMKKDGPRFKWDNSAAMHVSAGSAGSVQDDRKTTVLRALLGEVFKDGNSVLSYTEVKDGIVKARGCTPRWAEKQIETLMDKALVKQTGSGTYAIAD